MQSGTQIIAALREQRTVNEITGAGSVRRCEACSQDWIGAKSGDRNLTSRTKLYVSVYKVWSFAFSKEAINCRLSANNLKSHWLTYRERLAQIQGGSAATPETGSQDRKWLLKWNMWNFSKVLSGFVFWPTPSQWTFHVSKIWLKNMCFALNSGTMLLFVVCLILDVKSGSVRVCAVGFNVFVKFCSAVKTLVDLNEGAKCSLSTLLWSDGWWQVGGCAAFASSVSRSNIICPQWEVKENWGEPATELVWRVEGKLISKLIMTVISWPFRAFSFQTFHFKAGRSEIRCHEFGWLVWCLVGWLKPSTGSYNHL